MTGKEKCYKMKRLREKIAKENDISGFEFKECEFNGECEGYCPACDGEAMKLLELVHEKNKDNFVNPWKQNSIDDIPFNVPPLSGKVVEPRNVPPSQPPHVFRTEGVIIPRNENLLGGMKKMNFEENVEEPLMKKGIVKMPQKDNKKLFEDKKNPRGILNFRKKDKPEK